MAAAAATAETMPGIVAASESQSIQHRNTVHVQKEVGGDKAATAISTVMSREAEVVRILHFR